MKNIGGLLLAAGMGVLGAVSADLSAYRKALQANPKAKFDLKLAAQRWIQGGIAAVLAGIAGGVGQS